MERMNYSVKEMLAQDTDPNELTKNLENEINAALNELKVESQATIALDTAREEAAQAFYNYLIALEVIPAEVAAEMDINEITELLKSMEDQIKAYAAFSALAAGLGIELKPASKGKRAEVCKCKEVTPADEEVIREFLKSLRQ
ncbi:MAG: hypothetical protein IKT89_04545 [Clostridia bacterium]|nr:hypothetical protein [Clostridia bacterium]